MDSDPVSPHRCWLAGRGAVLGPNVIAEVRDSAGNCYNNGSYETNRYYRFASSSAAPFLGQKAVLALDGVPEDTAWVEIDIGYGELARTLHIALTKEAGT